MFVFGCNVYTSDSSLIGSDKFLAQSKGKSLVLDDDKGRATQKVAKQIGLGRITFERAKSAFVKSANPIE